MEKIKLNIKEMKLSRMHMFYDVLLQEEGGERMLDIAIGENEAHFMAIAMDGLRCPRPLTYDVMIDIMHKFSLELVEVEINRFYDGNYYALAYMESKTAKKEFQEKFPDKEYEPVKIDIRPSDAFNLAIRLNCPIYTTESVLEESGFDISSHFDNSTAEQKKAMESVEDLSAFGINMLQDLLADAVEKEDYKTASEIRDRIAAMQHKNGRM